jgi:hypothetical protein
VCVGGGGHCLFPAVVGVTGDLVLALYWQQCPLGMCKHKGRQRSMVLCAKESHSAVAMLQHHARSCHSQAGTVCLFQHHMPSTTALAPHDMLQLSNVEYMALFRAMEVFQEYSSGCHKAGRYGATQ